MKNFNFHKGILFLSGIIIFLVGAGVAFSPIEFYAKNSINLEKNASLLNEIRASGGLLFFSSIVIMLGVFIKRLMFTSTVLAALIYLSYGSSRVLSILIDGLPAETLFQATILEIILGLVLLFILVLYRKSMFGKG